MTDKKRHELFCSLPMDMGGHKRVAVAAIQKVGQRWQVYLLLKSLVWIEDGPNRTRVLLPFQQYRITSEKPIFSEDDARLLAVTSVIVAVTKWNIQ